MTIEHQTDGNRTRRGSEDRLMTGTTRPDDAGDLTIFQRAFVADHIADLEREAAALRAERARDHDREEHAPHARGTAVRAAPSRRVRIGLWLVAVGRAIAGDASSGGDLGDDAATRLPRAA